MISTLKDLFSGSRPIDWVMFVIEALVLLVILYEVIAGEVRRRKEAKRRTFLDARVVELSRARDEGKRLISVVPDAGTVSAQTRQPWVKAVADWTESTEKTLAGYSPHAADSFMQPIEAQTVDVVVTAHGRTFTLCEEIRTIYAKLFIRWENLCRILERPEMYF
jgi:hypothetical protein